MFCEVCVCMLSVCIPYVCDVIVKSHKLWCPVGDMCLTKYSVVDVIIIDFCCLQL